MTGCLFSNPSAGSASIFNPAASFAGIEALDFVLANAVPSYNGDDIMHASGDVILRSLALAETHLRARWPGLLATVVAATVAITTQTASVVARGSVQPGAPGLIATGSPATAPEAALNDAARSLLTQSWDRLPSLSGAGRSALARGRDEATVADFLRLRWIGRLDATLERYGRLLASPDPKAVALGIVGVQHYSELIHKALLQDGPDRIILVSLQAQRLVAYDHGRVILDTAVTTGRSALPTDVGAMHVVKKDSPWTMQSPWPKGSPYWYPDTQVRMVAWFTSTGEGLHDAAWEPLSAYGPGSQDGPFASHGCIHLPPASEAILFPWAAIGTPVVIYPGDGTPRAEQAAQRSVDASGNPIVSGVRGD